VAAASIEPVAESAPLRRRTPAVAQTADEPAAPPFAPPTPAPMAPAPMAPAPMAPAPMAPAPMAPAPFGEALPRRTPAAAASQDWSPEPLPRRDSAAADSPTIEPEARRPVFEAPAFEPSLVPVFDPASVTNAGPAPVSEERRRPADLSEVAAAWREVIEQRSAPDRPSDLAGYVGQSPRRAGEPGQPPKPGGRPTDLGSYTAEGRQAEGYGQTWQQETWRRPEHLGDEPPKPPRRPATLADHVPAQRRPEDAPTRDLSGYGEQVESQ
jgi:hypothetical protein